MGTPGRTLAIFDFDGTMIPGDSIVSLVLHALRTQRLPATRLCGILASATLHRLGLVSAERAKEKVFVSLQSMNSSQRPGFYRDFVQSVLVPAIYPAALTRMNAHRARGDLVFLVTASADLYMAHMQEFLPVDAVLATPVDNEGRVGRNCRGEEKVQRLLQWLTDSGRVADLGASWAYGDSLSDLPVLSLVGHGVRVNPKPALRRRRTGLPMERWTP